MFRDLKENKYFHIGLTAFLVIVASILVGFLLFKIGDIWKLIVGLFKLLNPFIIGFVFAYLLNPIVKFFDKNVVSKWVKSKDKKTINYLSILITCVLFIFIVVLLFSIIIPELLKSVEKLAVNAPRYIEEIKNYLLTKLGDGELREVILYNYEAINNYINNVVNVSLIPKIDGWLVSLSTGLIGVIKTLFNILLGFVIAIYFLADKDNFIGGFKKIIYTIFPIKVSNRIMENARHTDDIFGNFIVGRLLDGLVIGCITFAFLSIFGYPYALLIAVLVGITNTIPYFGPWFGGIPAVLLVLMDDPTKALIFGIFIVVLQQIDGNVIGPKLCGSRIGLKSFWVLASILFFGGLFGVVGMLIGVPLFALIYGHLDHQITLSLKRRELPTKNSDYLNLDRINCKTKKTVELEK